MILDYLTYVAIAVIVIIFIFLASAIRILREYERGVVFMLGRFTGAKGPGLIILIPIVQQMVKVEEPQAMQLRYFAALHDIAGDQSSTVVFPLPVNLLDHLGPRSAS
ncbi:MAG: hypothetical protein KGL35_02750 [Bradyrhizobium sp.]|uniref:hypothetical protein n=1 Tax=Bradyrhizobium sp. TaxID=376 RepID=UPI001C29A5D9|nr:hypothetical protein [Bradyrhizobium sp.]MBU6461349.1 hypothetical protein [Pseudomonadota bacterium]MDE2066524.1 hypothetical protein [Bradyrhizobium sp.]MDE2467672.1 hypothetical protein [Bradyrhizobium sp.]